MARASGNPAPAQVGAVEKAAAPRRGLLGRWPALDLARPSNQHRFAYLLLLPAVILIFLIIVYPLILSVDLSFQNVKIARIGGARKDFTFANYERLFTSPEFWRSCWVTLQLIITVTASCFVIGMATALMLNQAFRGRTLARLLLALPWAIPEVVAVVVWWWIFDSSFGVMNWLLVMGGLVDKPIGWFSSAGSAFFVVSVVMIWKGYPFVSIMLLAGLQAIPEDFYQAAHVDGANAWQVFRHITFPLLSPTTYFLTLISVIGTFKAFNHIWVMRLDAALGTADTFSVVIFTEFFEKLRYGYASAMALVLFAIIFGLTFVNNKIQGSRVFYG